MRRRVDDVLPERRAGLGQGQRAVEVALRVPTATSSAGSTPTCATSAPHFVTRLLEPLLTDPAIGVREGLLPPSARTATPTGGGRVTELVARPLLSSLFPQLADFVQPLAGEYAGRRDAARGAAVRRGLGRRARAAHRPRRALRPRRGRAGRPRRARAPQPPARRARPAGDGDPRHRPAARRRARRQAPAPSSCATTTTGSSSASRSRSASAHRCVTVARVPRRFGRELRVPDRRTLGSTSSGASRPASTAASSTSSAARANASPACQTRSVSASTLHAGVDGRARRARRR